MKKPGGAKSPSMSVSGVEKVRVPDFPDFTTTEDIFKAVYAISNAGAYVAQILVKIIPDLDRYAKGNGWTKTQKQKTTAALQILSAAMIELKKQETTRGPQPDL